MYYLAKQLLIIIQPNLFLEKYMYMYIVYVFQTQNDLFKQPPDIRHPMHFPRKSERDLQKRRSTERKKVVQNEWMKFYSHKTFHFFYSS